MKKVRSSQAYISISYCTELSKTQFSLRVLLNMDGQNRATLCHKYFLYTMSDSDAHFFTGSFENYDINTMNFNDTDKIS